MQESNALPSPNDLKHKIIIKHKAPKRPKAAPAAATAADEDVPIEECYDESKVGP